MLLHLRQTLLAFLASSLLQPALAAGNEFDLEIDRAVFEASIREPGDINLDASRKRIGNSLVVELHQKFQENLEYLQQGIEDSDLGICCTVSRYLKGTSFKYGLYRVENKCVHIESFACVEEVDEFPLDKVSHLIEIDTVRYQLEEECHDTLRLLDHWFKTGEYL